MDAPPSDDLNDLQNYLVSFNKEIEPNGGDAFSGGGDSGAQQLITRSPGVTEEEEGDEFVDRNVGGDSSTFHTKDDQLETDDSSKTSIGLGGDKELDKVMNPNTQVAPVGDAIPSSLLQVPETGVEGQGVRIVAAGQQGEELMVSENEGVTDMLTRVTSVPLDIVPIGEPTVNASGKGELIKLQMPVSGSNLMESKFVQLITINGQEHLQLVEADPRAITSGAQVLQLPPLSAGLSAGTSSDMEEVEGPKGDIDGADPVAVLASVVANTSSISSLQGDNVATEINQAQLVAVQSSSDNSQPHLVAVQAEGQEAVMAPIQGLPGNGEFVTIVPSEIDQNGEMKYVLIVSQPEKGAEDGTGDAKDEDLEQVLEEVVDEYGVTRHYIRIAKKSMSPGTIITTGDGQTHMTCRYCSYSSPKRYLLMRHMKTHSMERPHLCNICNRSFKTMASLQNHVNTHTGVKPHKCKDCESAFTTSGELVRHIRYKHTLEKPHKCTECDYASVELSKLKRHMRSHTGERPYLCPHCTYASPDTYKLKRHLRIHTGEKPYECDICHAHFTQSNSLKAHRLIHTGEKPVYQCELCPTTCGRKTDLKIHMNKLHNSEKPLECKKCLETFPDRYTFKVHMKKHEGERCFKCEECGYAGQSQRNLETHQLVHTGERPFECGECEQTFRQKQLLKRHIQLYHFSEEEGGLEKLTCFYCPRSFAYKRSLQKHLQTHVNNLSDPQVRQVMGQDTTLADEVKDKGLTDNGVASVVTSGSAVDATPLSVPLRLMSKRVGGFNADQYLQENLVSELREGKLGVMPKIVIVHPDGHEEEVTAKLQNLAQEKVLEEVLMADLDGDEVSAINRATKAVENSQAVAVTLCQNVNNSSSSQSLTSGACAEIGSGEKEEQSQEGEEQGKEGEELMNKAPPTMVKNPQPDSLPVHTMTSLIDQQEDEHKDVQTQVALESDSDSSSEFPPLLGTMAADGKKKMLIPLKALKRSATDVGNLWSSKKKKT